MRIAVVADIHGNIRALRAVMEDLKQVAPDRVVNLGDCASGPLEAAETIDVLMSLAWTTVRGNHDRQLLDRPVEKMGKSDAAAFAELKNHHHAWLSTLEETATIEDIFLCHGTPGNDTTYLLETVQPDGQVRLATQAEVSRRLGSEHSPIVLCGHTHVSRIVRLTDGRTVVNPGSVGLPAYSDREPAPHSMEMGAPHARYAVLKRAKAAEPWQVSLRVVAYDWEGAAARAASKGREDWARWIRTGYAN
ncbi:MAG: metallophosphoesterase family protein [Alphaproteobacteria bacterium]|nr:MAG: metallophosphoesterase family protein [Alphaproteobacteria bacterium]